MLDCRSCQPISPPNLSHTLALAVDQFLNTAALLDSTRHRPAFRQTPTRYVAANCAKKLTRNHARICILYFSNVKWLNSRREKVNVHEAKIPLNRKWVTNSFGKGDAKKTSHNEHREIFLTANANKPMAVVDQREAQNGRNFTPVTSNRADTATRHPCEP